MNNIAVRLDETYTKELKQELQNLITLTVKEQTEKIQPTKRYYNRRELMKFLGCGGSTIEILQMNGLQYVQLGRQTLFDIEQVHEVLHSLKK